MLKRTANIPDGSAYKRIKRTRNTGIATITGTLNTSRIDNMAQYPPMPYMMAPCMQPNQKDCRGNNTLNTSRAGKKLKTSKKGLQNPGHASAHSTAEPTTYAVTRPG